jgi:hypothetical protein
MMSWFAMGGAAASWFGAGGWTHKAWHVRQLGSAAEHSLPGLLMTLTSMLLALSYLMYLHNWPGFAGQLTCLLSCLTVLRVKLRKRYAT